jgi:uridine kinase
VLGHGGAPLSQTRAFVIAIGGGSASGKTTLAGALPGALVPLSSALIAEDDYYKDNQAEPGFVAEAYNFDHPDARDHGLLAAHLDALRAGQGVDQPLYDFTIHGRRPQTRRIEPCDVVIVEGIHILCTPDLLRRVDLKVYVDTPDDVRLARRLLRDVAERGRAPDFVVNQYLSTVRPMHVRFTEPTKWSADLMIADSVESQEALDARMARYAALIADAVRGRRG